MAWIGFLTVVALLTVVASSVKAAPASFEHHEYHPIVALQDVKYEILALPIPELHQGLANQNLQEPSVENRKFLRPYHFFYFYPFILSHPNHPLNNPYPELAEAAELADDETPIAEVDAQVVQTDDNEEGLETIEILQAYENEPAAQLDDGKVKVADVKLENVLAVDTDEGNVN